ncbi:MAG TPA: lytic transglycosylase domain-containing protein [Candidatus Acidoferrales bacterium]|nr:lytic transglycosylase domain-containing protein [Candidatus Acidoferrales bacterium]
MSIEADLQAVCSRIAEITASLDDRPAVHSAARTLTSFASFVRRENGAAPPARVPAGVAELANRAGAQTSLDPALIEAVIASESSYDPHAVSPAGARGLMQLMPATAAELGVVDPDDPAQNVAGGARYLRSLLDRYAHDVPLALAAYNAGPGAVHQFGGIPPYAQTRAYVAHVLATFHTLDRR